MSARAKTVTVILMAAGIALAAIGAAMGQTGSVLAKAVTICLECVGIG